MIVYMIASPGTVLGVRIHLCFICVCGVCVSVCGECDFVFVVFGILSDRGISRRLLLMIGRCPLPALSAIGQTPCDHMTHTSDMTCRILFPGIVLWSVSTAAAFFAVDFWTFLVCRMGVSMQ